MIWKKISLRIRIYIILTALIFITFTGGLVMVWYTYRIEGLFTDIIDKNIAAFILYILALMFLGLCFSCFLTKRQKHPIMNYF